MCLLAGEANATTDIANRLWENRHRSDGQNLIAQEGDGYGLGCPNWLEDPSVPNLVRELYLSLGDDASPDVLRADARRRRADLLTVVEHHLRDQSPSIRATSRRLWSEATGALQLTEEHASLMHARLPHELRALTLRLGAALTDTDQIDEPDDIFYLHTNDLATADATGGLRKHVSRHRGAIERLHDGDECSSGDCYGDSPAATLFRRLFQPASRARTPTLLSGHPGSPGLAAGPVRRLFWQTDIANVRPGDVLVTPQSAAGWSIALPAAAAVVSESGHPYGHLAALARDYAKPAVIGVGDSSDLLDDGRWVEVDGTTGEVRLDIEPR